ncbi:MAG: CDP-alcohol phosphatidyltransferase family protein [Chloroflexi bacterium]|nr:CDP-alcohol phosphatidyltransferase family protein [Chloroflexota bacterium]MBU1749129.1 CDP-alcohol phosphatidyltransferase family protein [Chloroflexota bacterium]MBU1879550.1 CDP-alcohol phosphatidyltransferase family protein [Chloroflexota bacterium]
MKTWGRGLITPLARLLGRLGFTPNALTLVGVLLNGVVALVIGVGFLFWGGVGLLLASAFDALDGVLARSTGQATRFGAFFDSNMDRLAEVLIYGGLLYHYARQGGTWEALLCFAALTGSLLVSYARARAEGLGFSCTVGFFTRAERIILLSLGLMLTPLVTAMALPFDVVSVTLIIIAVGAHLTAWQRILHVYRTDRRERE